MAERLPEFASANGVDFVNSVFPQLRFNENIWRVLPGRFGTFERIHPTRRRHVGRRLGGLYIIAFWAILRNSA